MQCLITERPRLNVRTKTVEVRGRGEKGVEAFCSIDCDLPHLEQITGQSG